MEDLTVDESIAPPTLSPDVVVENSKLHDTIQYHDSSQYTSMEEMSLDSLPSEIRHESVLQLLLLARILTAKITVTRTSHARSRRFSIQGESSMRVGTGSLIDTKRCSLQGQSSLLKLSSADSNGTLYVLASKHLVYDSEEALCTIVEFYGFFDNCQTVRVSGSDIQPFPCPDDDSCLLVCEDVSGQLILQLNEKQKQLVTIERSIPRHVKQVMSNHAFLVSYPYGKKQMISHGRAEMGTYSTISQMVGPGCYISVEKNMDSAMGNILLCFKSFDFLNG